MAIIGAPAAVAHRAGVWVDAAGTADRVDHLVLSVTAATVMIPRRIAATVVEATLRGEGAFGANLTTEPPW